MKEAGNLEGILLTGLSKDGVDLMESYVDHTGDVQTASFCMLKVQQQTVYANKSYWHQVHIQRVQELKLLRAVMQIYNMTFPKLRGEKTF